MRQKVPERILIEIPAGRVGDDALGSPDGETPVKRSPRSLVLRRALGISILVALAAGIHWAVFTAGLLDPVLALIAPTQDAVRWIAEDPQRAWLALAALIVPHLGLYYLIFENRTQ